LGRRKPDHEENQNRRIFRILELEKGKEYQFRYVIDGKEWINEEQADKFVPNAFQTENSVVVV
jgi:hypothetical protein